MQKLVIERVSGGGQRDLKPGFTLAEVLITLGIIGVVAAMTLPAITQKIDKQITVSKLKKSFSTLQQVIRLSEKDNGEVSEWTFPSETDYAANKSEFLKNILNLILKLLVKPVFILRNMLNIGFTILMEMVQLAYYTGIYCLMELL